MKIVEKKINESFYRSKKSVEESLFNLLLEIYEKKQSEVTTSAEFLTTLREVCYSVIISFEDEARLDLEILLNKIKKIKF
jgi:hypothetical protein